MKITIKEAKAQLNKVTTLEALSTLMNVKV